MRLAVAVVSVRRPQFYCPTYNSDDVMNYYVEAIDICSAAAAALSMLCVAIFRNRFDDTVAPNIGAPSSAVADGFDAAIALARAVPATNTVALDVVGCTMMMIAAMMMMKLPPMSPLQATFDCCESWIGPSENEMIKKNKTQ